MIIFGENKLELEVTHAMNICESNRRIIPQNQIIEN